MFRANETIYTRNDQTLSHEGKQIELTIYDPQLRHDYLVLYLHGNSSSRLEASNLIKYLPKGFSLACFDFMGCGKNEEEDTISLGYRESRQV